MNLFWARSLASRILVLVFLLTLPFRTDQFVLCINPNCGPSIEFNTGSDDCHGCPSSETVAFEAGFSDCCIESSDSYDILTNGQGKFLDFHPILQFVETFNSEPFELFSHDRKSVLLEHVRVKTDAVSTKFVVLQI